jgi:RecB family exonuclease
MRQLSASKITLAKACLAWLRSDAPEWDDKKGPSARLGNAFHRFAELVTKRQNANTSELAKQYELRPAQARDLARMVMRWTDWKQHRMTGAALAEVKFAYDPFTRVARLLDGEGDRNYEGSTPTEIVGTADLVQPEGNGVVWVTDYKTGRYVPEAEDSDQVSFLSVAAASCKQSTVTEVRGSLTRVSVDDCYETPRVIRKRFHLDVIGDELEQLAEDMAKEEEGEATPTPGPHCRGQWCPVRHACSAYASYDDAMRVA